LRDALHLDEDEQMGEQNLETMDREKRAVALSSVLAAVVLTVTKVIVGISTNSLGIYSEAAHSGLDLIAAGVTLWAVRAAGVPADRRHTYGHGKVENLSALFETLLLLGTCVWIVREAITRLASHESPVVNPSGWAFGVVILSIFIDVSRSRALMRVARKYDSQALEADALHFSTDILSSIVVLVGLLGVKLARPLGLPWLQSADAVAALGVAVIVFIVCLRLARRSVDDLLDAVQPEIVDKVRAAALVQGVISVGQARVRRSGADCYADITVFAAANLELSAAHDIANAVERAVAAAVPRVKTMVHVEPSERDAPTPSEG
jgi:cation diffusion facilitator family transporter